MSVLAPLYLLGLAAISLPLVFHLIRRSPRGELPFSSTMFLTASPPRLTRRSRLDNLLLLLLRGLALALLACAFARPFLRQAAQLTQDEVGQQRLVVLVDSSASMRRGELWNQAVAKVDQKLADFRPQDEVAVYTFDDRLQPIATYDELNQVEPSRRRAIVESRLQSRQPTWVGTHLGQALAEAAVLVSQSRDVNEEQGRRPRRIVLISDMQEGCRLEELGQLAWPPDVTLELVPLTPANPTNAGLERLADVELAPENQQQDAQLRIRVTNVASSNVEQFSLQWGEDDESAVASPLDVYAPAGESRVARVPMPPARLASPRLMLTGDAHDFDNTLYFLPTRNEPFTVVYLGTDSADDPEQMRYYLQRVLESDRSHEVNLIDHPPSDSALLASDEKPQLVVVTAPPTHAQALELKDYLTAGGSLLYVVTSSNDGDALERLLEANNLNISEGTLDGYTMLGHIDFQHPLFAPMAGPRFNDFAQIRFWKYHRLDLASLPDARMIASFENGDPAIVQQAVGDGHAVVMAAGWRPSDGQLALSWKFVLMISSLIEDDRQSQVFSDRYLVNEKIAIPSGISLPVAPEITKPNGDSLQLARDARSITETDLPGVYTLTTDQEPVRFVVHVDPQESETAPLPVEKFEQLGCQLASPADAQQQVQRRQQMRDVELEGRQKIWKWLVALALAVLIMESLLAGWFSRPQDAQMATG